MPLSSSATTRVVPAAAAAGVVTDWNAASADVRSSALQLRRFPLRSRHPDVGAVVDGSGDDVTSSLGIRNSMSSTRGLLARQSDSSASSGAVEQAIEVSMDEMAIRTALLRTTMISNPYYDIGDNELAMRNIPIIKRSDIHFVRYAGHFHRMLMHFFHFVFVVILSSSK